MRNTKIKKDINIKQLMPKQIIGAIKLIRRQNNIKLSIQVMHVVTKTYMFL